MHTLRVKKCRVNPARYGLNGVLIQSGNSNPNGARVSVARARFPPVGKSLSFSGHPRARDIRPAWESLSALEYSKRRRRRPNSFPHRVPAARRPVDIMPKRYIENADVPRATTVYYNIVISCVDLYTLLRESRPSKSVHTRGIVYDKNMKIESTL